MDEIESEKMKTYIYGGMFAIANRLQVLGDKFDENISTKQWFLIAIIESFREEKPTISMTAERMGTSRQNVKKMAQILANKGFLDIVKDENDARIQRLISTKYCREYFAARANREEQYIEDLFKNFDVEMLSTMCKCLSQFEKNIEGMSR